ncbi:MAG: prepilin-type N-terminal cleavage/methylation domain-containing protein [Bradymonadaceae bacterium]|nr:prepilin-type N-terminal cleavage/methylation domain-containing protein [Lujinxingiaceae bacterium]
MVSFSPKSLCLRPKGLTLVELMIVVAILGVLATIASVSFTKYVKQGKITKLKQYAMDVSRGQEQYRARNNTYWPPAKGTSTFSATTKTAWNQLLEFNHTLEAGITIETESGQGNNCGICEGVLPADNAVWWYAVRVRQPLTSGTALADQTAIVYHSQIPAPVVIREGK